MDAYETLRKQARNNRDDAIRTARIEYKQSVRRIDDLQRRLASAQAKPLHAKPVIEVVSDLIPRDRTFTLPEVIDAVRCLDPRRTATVIRGALERLDKQGMIHRVRRTEAGLLWAAAGYGEPETPYASDGLREVAVDMLREAGPLTATELVVAIRERGYRDDADPHKLLNALRHVLKRDAVFRKDEAGKWTAVAT